MNWAVVMAGGPGTRFWPLSRSKRPKPFLRLLGRQTLLEETVRRLPPLFPPNRILVVIQDSLVKEARRLLPEIPRENILGEPIGRNTALCCVWAASQIARRDPGAKLVFLPADQWIRPKSLYLKTLRTAFRLVDERPVLIGMIPDSPETGYGYLEVSREKEKVNGIFYFSVKRFREKPPLAQARRFLKQGNFLWNGGTFIWRLDQFKEALRKYVPPLHRAFEKLRSFPEGDKKKLRAIYRSLPSLSLDYAVMEKMKDVHCLLSPFEWRDLGSWEALAKFWPQDREGNRVERNKTAPPIFIESRGNLVKTQKRLIALLGIENLLVVDTPDALLIADRRQIEQIREVVRELARRKQFEMI